MIVYCPICKTTNAKFEQSSEMYLVDCKICGKYSITKSASAIGNSQYGPSYLLSGIVRNRTLAGEELTLSAQSFEHLTKSFNIPRDPIAKVDLLLKNTLTIATRIDRFINYQANFDYALIFAQDEAEFWYIANIALDQKLIERGPNGYRVSILGWKRLDELKRTSIIGDQVFVAMWFDSELDTAWENGIQEGIKDCNYTPIRIDLQEHNEKICDRIILEIRKSSLVVADFTGQRGGVYYESGFAEGLGIPVIRTCRKDHIKKVHFDTRQYSHVVWETPDELRKKLAQRIQATYPRNKAL